MKLKFSVILSSIALALSVGAGISFSKNNKVQSADAIGSYSTDASTYYNGITATSGQALAGQLHDLITSTHRYYTSYADNGGNGYQKNTDQYYENGSKVNGYIYEFYSGVKWPSAWDPDSGSTTGGYNREHCWCQSNSVNAGGTQMWGESGGGADMHHLRPVEARLNSTRSNNKYGEISSRDSYKVYAKLGTQTTYALGGYNHNSVFEPLDSKKGDVARIILYIYLHYNSYSVSSVFGSGNATTNGNGNSSYFSSSLLSLTKIMNQSTEANALELLLEWNASDPVDEIEQRRNEQVAVYQGNRNPFIDNSNYAEMIWGTGTANPTVNSVNVSPSSLSLDLNGTTSGNLTATVTVTNGAAQTVNWTSSNTNVATVSSSGVVTAVAKGSCTITATSTVNSNKSASCSVTVADSSGSGGGQTVETITWTRVTSVADLTAGTYIMGYEATAGSGTLVPLRSDTAAATTSTNGHFHTGTTSGSSGSGTLTMSTLGDGGSGYEVTVSIVSSGVINIQNAAGNYYGATSGGTTSNKGRFYTSGNSNETNLTVTYSSNKFSLVASGVSGDYKNMKYNTNSGQERYAFYKTAAAYDTSFYKKGTEEVSVLSPLASISLNTSNVETNFYVGDTFDYSGLVVTAHYEDGTEDIVTPSGVSSPDMTSSGDKTVTVTYYENGVTKTNSYTITVSAVALSSIEVDNAKTNYHVGDSFVAPTVYGNYSNNSTVEITSNITFSGYDLSTEGTQTVTVSYSDKTTTYEILVSAASAITDSTIYTLISSTSDLEVGKSYIITNGTTGTVKALSNATNANNRKSTEVTISNGKITRGSSIMSFTLGGTTDAYTFETENYTGTAGYLASGTGDNNYLRVITTAGSSSIAFNNEAATIHIGPHSSRTLICFNQQIDSNNGGFACYSAQGSYGLVYLWKEVSKNLSSISLDTTNVQTTFTVGSTFNYTGLVVTANYSDSSSSTVTPTSVSSPDMSSTGSKTVTVTYTEDEVSKTASYTITVNSNPSISWTAPTIVEYTGSSLSGTDVNGWAVTYNDGAGNQTVLTYSQLTVKLGGTTISIPHTWVAADNGKTLTATYNSLTTSQSSAVDIIQSINNVYADTFNVTTKTWTATAAANFGSKISDVDETDTGTVSFDDSSSMSYIRTLEFVASGKEDYIAFTDNYIQFGSSNALEKLELTAATSGTVTSVVVDCWSKNGAATISATVGGNAFGTSQSTPSAKNSTPITFSGSAVGTVVITMENSTKTAGTAQYIKSVAITTETKTGTTQIANSATHMQAQKAAVKFAKAFNDAMSSTSYCTANLSTAWSTCASAYSTFLTDAAALGSTEEAYAKNLIKYATRQYSDDSGEACIERMMKTYEICVQKHGQTAFMDDLVSLDSAHVSPLINIVGEKTNLVAVIVIISMVSVTAIGGYFFLKKRKENE